MFFPCLIAKIPWSSRGELFRGQSLRIELVQKLKQGKIICSCKTLIVLLLTSHRYQMIAIDILIYIWYTIDAFWMCLESQAPSLSHWLFFGDFAVDYRSKEFNKKIVFFFQLKKRRRKTQANTQQNNDRWFHICFIFAPTLGNHPIWLTYFLSGFFNH